MHSTRYFLWADLWSPLILPEAECVCHFRGMLLTIKGFAWKLLFGLIYKPGISLLIKFNFLVIFKTTECRDVPLTCVRIISLVHRISLYIFFFRFLFLKKLQKVSAHYCLLLNFKGSWIKFCSEEPEYAVSSSFFILKNIFWTRHVWTLKSN